MNDDPWCICTNEPAADCPRHGELSGEPAYLSDDDREFLAMLDAFNGRDAGS